MLEVSSRNLCEDLWIRPYQLGITNIRNCWKGRSISSSETLSDLIALLIEKIQSAIVGVFFLIPLINSLIFITMRAILACTSPLEIVRAPFQILREGIPPVTKPNLNAIYTVDRTHVGAGLRENRTVEDEAIAKEVLEKISQTLKQLRSRILMTLIGERNQPNADISSSTFWYYLKAVGEDLGIERTPWERHRSPFEEPEMEDADKRGLIDRFYQLYTPQEIYSEIYATFNGGEGDLTAISPSSSLSWFCLPETFLNRKRKEFLEQVLEREAGELQTLECFKQWIEKSKYPDLLKGLLKLLNGLGTQTVSELLTTISEEEKSIIFDYFLVPQDEEAHLSNILQAIQTDLKALFDPQNAGLPLFIEKILERRNVPRSEWGPIEVALKGCFSCHHALHLLNMMKEGCENPSMVRDWCSEYLFGEGTLATDIKENPPTLREEVVEDCLVQLGILFPIE